MMVFVTVSLLVVVALASTISLADSAVRGGKAYRLLRQSAKARTPGQAIQVTIIEPAGLKAPAPFKLPAFNRSNCPAAANSSQPLPAAA